MLISSKTFCSKKRQRERERERRHLPRPYPTCTCWQTKPLLCLTGIIFKTVKNWRGKCIAVISITKAQRENTAFHGEIGGYSVCTGSWFLLRYRCCTQVKVSGKNILHAPLTHSQPTSPKNCRHSPHRHCLMSNPNELQVIRSKKLAFIHVLDVILGLIFVQLWAIKTSVCSARDAEVPSLLLP